MPKVTPILIFAGQARQAIELYQKAFGATVKEILTYEQMKPSDMEGPCKEEYKHFISWSEIKIGSQLISLADDSDAAEKAATGDVNAGSTFLIDLLVHLDSDDDLCAAYKILSDGGTITAPLSSPSYCSLTCAIVDKYGGRWQLMTGYAG